MEGEENKERMLKTMDIGKMERKKK